MSLRPRQVQETSCAPVGAGGRTYETHAARDTTHGSSVSASAIDTGGSKSILTPISHPFLERDQRETITGASHESEVSCKNSGLGGMGRCRRQANGVDFLHSGRGGSQASGVLTRRQIRRLVKHPPFTGDAFSKSLLDRAVRGNFVNLQVRGRHRDEDCPQLTMVALKVGGQKTRSPPVPASHHIGRVREHNGGLLPTGGHGSR